MNKHITTFKFSFSKGEIQKLRNRSRSDYDCLSEIKIYSGDTKISFWNQYISVLYRIDETIDYLNSLELATEKYTKHAFDLYAFITQADVVIQAIRILGKTFDLKMDMKKITDSKKSFGNAKLYQDSRNYIPINAKGNDGKFWEYLRSITSIHPNETSKSNFLHSKTNKDRTGNGEEDSSLLHVSPYAMWNQYNPPFSTSDGDIDITIYAGESKSFPKHIIVEMEMIVKFINKWINFLEVIENRIDSLKVERKERLVKTPLKALNDFEGKIHDFLNYLELEYKKRYSPDLVDDENENFFSQTIINFFDTKHINQNKQKFLNEFLDNLKSELNELRKSIQNMEEDPLSTINIDPYVLAQKCNIKQIDDFSYQFEKLYFINQPYIHANENYMQSDLEKKIFFAIDCMIEDDKSIGNINQYLSVLYSKFHLSDEIWGRIQGYLIAKMILQDDTIDFSLNHWMVYVQLVLAFWEKGNNTKNMQFRN